MLPLRIPIWVPQDSVYLVTNIRVAQSRMPRPRYIIGRLLSCQRTVRTEFSEKPCLVHIEDVFYVKSLEILTKLREFYFNNHSIYRIDITIWNLKEDFFSLSHIMRIAGSNFYLQNCFNTYHPKIPYTIFTIKVVGSVFCSCRIVQCNLDTVRDKYTKGDCPWGTVRRGLGVRACRVQDIDLNANVCDTIFISCISVQRDEGYQAYDLQRFSFHQLK